MEAALACLGTRYHQDDTPRGIDGTAYSSKEPLVVLPRSHTNIVRSLVHCPVLALTAQSSEDIHLTRATDDEPTQPAYYHRIFERGIDPDVDDPSKCHDHSELPDVFPNLEDILHYRERVKQRIASLYENGEAYSDRCIGRALWIGFEHEGRHHQACS